MQLEKKTLAELCRGGKGSYGIGAPAVPFSDSLYTYLRITDIKDDGTLDKSGLKSVAAPNASAYLLEPDDIVFARTGASTGRNYFYDGADGSLVYAGFLIKFSLDPAKVNPKFVKYYCLSQPYKDWIRSFSTGSTRGNLNEKTLGAMELYLPPRAQQDATVSILSPLDEKIALNQAINENLLSQSDAIYRAWFEDSISCGKALPSSWSYATLGQIADISSGKRPPMKSDTRTRQAQIPLIGAASVMGFTNMANHSENILVTGRVGTHGVVQRFSSPCWTSDNTLVITSKYYEYVYQILKRIDYSAINRGSTQPLITQSDMKKIPVLMPNPSVLLEFENLVGDLMRPYKVNNAQNQILSEMRDALLPRLISGELDVSAHDL